MLNYFKLILITSSLIVNYKSSAQKVIIDLGPDEIAQNELYRITLTVRNGKLRNYKGFPDIPGLVKRGTSSSSSTNIVNGKVTSSQSIIQNYQARNQGQITIRPFIMVVNNKKYKSPGKVLKIGPPVKARSQRKNLFNMDPFQDFFDEPKRNEFVDVKANAFLALTTNKDEIYAGEGLITTLAFYVSKKNKADMRFYNLGNQIADIVKKIKPENCWEENFSIDNIRGVPININNERYTQYKIYQAAFYPLNVDTIQFPPVGLELIKYKVAKNPSFFGRNRQEDYKTFYSKPKTIVVKELPDHPLKESVSVGNYRLDEQISAEGLNTGESFNYTFKVEGLGNISAIKKPDVSSSENFDFYPPNITQDIVRSSNVVSGSKAFNYYGIPKEPGTYKLKDYFSWVYFNTKIDDYDTLASGYVLKVTGESKKNDFIQSNDMGSFYDMIEFQGNTLKSIDAVNYSRIFANVLIFIMIVLSFYFVIRK